MKIAIPEILINAAVRRAERSTFLHLHRKLHRGWLINPGLVGRLLKLGVTVNKIMASDRARHAHDHPQSYIEVVLRGGFTEVKIHDTLIEAHRYACRHRAKHGMPQVRHNKEMGRWESHAYYGAGAVLFRKASDPHRLQLDDHPSATILNIAAGRAQAWGYATPDGKILKDAYQVYLDDKLLDALGREEIEKAYGVYA